MNDSALPARFWAKVRITNDCWLWTAAVQSKGYGSFAVGGVTYQAHRLAYEDRHGPIPDGLQIDHLCRVRQCVNPDHMEPVTSVENTRRGFFDRGECKNGHDLTQTPAYVTTTAAGRKRRECRQCRAERANARRVGVAS